MGCFNPPMCLGERDSYTVCGLMQEPPPEKQKPAQENDEPKAMDTDAPQQQASVSEDPSAEKRAKGTEYYQAGNWQVRSHFLFLFVSQRVRHCTQ